MNEKGLKSLTDLEVKKLTLQKTLSSKIKSENKLLTSKNMLVNTRVELLSLKSQYVDKIAKAESEKQAALSAMYEAESIVTKNAESVHEFFYKKRILLYYFSSGWYITKSLRAGIGETVRRRRPYEYYAC